MDHNPSTPVTVTLCARFPWGLLSSYPDGKAPILTSFAQAISDAFKAARAHAVLVRDIDEAKHIAICEQFASRVQIVFADASAASDALRHHEQFDANHRAKIYSLSIKRNFLSSATLHFRVDASARQVWWQLMDTPAVREYAGWGWSVVPVLTVPDFATYLQRKVLDLIGTLQEDATTGTVIRSWGSQF